MGEAMKQPTVVKIDLQRCINCSLCRRACPTEAINYFSTGHRTHVVNPKDCIGCDICVKVCPVDCIHEDPDYVIDAGALALAKDKARAFAKRQHTIKVLRQQRTSTAIGLVGGPRSSATGSATADR
jgi:electron transport complex protein RnfB